MPAAKPPEFRRRTLDLVAQGESVSRVAKDLGISESCLRRGIEVEAIDTGRKEGTTSAEKAELVELRRRNRVLEGCATVVRQSLDHVLTPRPAAVHRDPLRCCDRI